MNLNQKYIYIKWFFSFFILCRWIMIKIFFFFGPLPETPLVNGILDERGTSRASRLPVCHGLYLLAFCTEEEGARWMDRRPPLWLLFLWLRSISFRDVCATPLPPPPLSLTTKQDEEEWERANGNKANREAVKQKLLVLLYSGCIPSRPSCRPPFI